ncbi:MAG: hypothetical protein Q9209_001669 [Squamulea sp. 1 TL-2023]
MTPPKGPTSLHLNCLESLAKIHKFYTIQRANATSPPELTNAIQDHLTALHQGQKETHREAAARNTARLTKIATLLGCHHSDRAAEEACVFAKLHQVILDRIRSFNDLTDNKRRKKRRGSDTSNDDEDLPESDDVLGKDSDNEEYEDYKRKPSRRRRGLFGKRYD